MIKSFLKKLIKSKTESHNKHDANILSAHEAGLKEGWIQPVDEEKIVSSSSCPQVPDFYRDLWFECKDCLKQELWTAKDQKIWYEDLGGVIESKAVRCRECRAIERKRKEQARKSRFRELRKNK